MFCPEGGAGAFMCFFLCWYLFYGGWLFVVKRVFEDIMYLIISNKLLCFSVISV